MADVKATIGADSSEYKSAMQKAREDARKLKQEAVEASKAAAAAEKERIRLMEKAQSFDQKKVDALREYGREQMRQRKQEGGTGQAIPEHSKQGIMSSLTRKLGALVASVFAARQIWSVADDVMTGEVRGKLDREAQKRENRKSLVGASFSTAAARSETSEDITFQKTQELEGIRQRPGLQKTADWLSGKFITDWFRKRQLKTDIEATQQQQGVAVNVAAEAGKREQRIDILRAQGKEALADAEQRKLDLANAELKIMENNKNLSYAQRQLLLNKVRNDKAVADASATIAQQEKLGITAVASSKAQLGLGGGVALFGRNPDDAAVGEANQILSRILTALERGNGNTATQHFSREYESRGAIKP